MASWVRVPVLLLCCLRLVLTSDAVTQTQDDLTQAKSYRRANESGRIFTDGVLFAVNAGSLIQCALTCLKTEGCISYTYGQLTNISQWGSCRGHSDDQLDCEVTAAGFEFYVYASRADAKLLISNRTSPDASACVTTQYPKSNISAATPSPLPSANTGSPAASNTFTNTPNIKTDTSIVTTTSNNKEMTGSVISSAMPNSGGSSQTFSESSTSSARDSNSEDSSTESFSGNNDDDDD